MWASENSLLWAQAENGIVGLWRCYAEDFFSRASLPLLHLPPSASPTHSITEQSALWVNTMLHQFSFPWRRKHCCPYRVATRVLALHLGFCQIHGLDLMMTEVFYETKSLNNFSWKEVVGTCGRCHF